MSFERAIAALARAAVRRPATLVALALLLSIPCLLQVRTIRLDTDLKRLLPRDSRASSAARELEAVVGGDGGYFSILFEGEDRESLRQAQARMAERARRLPDVQAVEDRNPIGFLRRWGYLLVPSSSLREALAYVDRLEAEANPLLVDLEEDGPSGHGDTAEIERRIERYLDLGEIPESADGRVIGLLVRPARAVTSLGETRRLYERLLRLAESTGRELGVAAWVSGSNRNKIDNYLQIREDLNVSGTVAGIGILLVLVVAYRSLRVLPVVLLPLGLGLLWSYSFVPWLVGDLNLITSFLLMVLFGTGVEFAVHLVMRFQSALTRGAVEAALRETFCSTGRSIVTSGFATTIGVAVLVFSEFRGFREFGIISATAIFAIFGAMFLVLPPALVLGVRLGLVRPREEPSPGRIPIPSRTLTVAFCGVVLVAAAVVVSRLGFDHDFTRLQPEIEAARAARERHRAVYRGLTVPGGFYVARDLPTLDRALSVIEEARSRRGEGSALGAAASIRDFVPGSAELAERRRLLDEIQERLRGRWTTRVQDEKKRRFIADVLAFEPPAEAPRVEDLPPEILRRLAARDGSGEWVVAVEVEGRARDGRTAMRFTEQAYALEMPEGVRGPTGDKPVLAELLWLVSTEGPWLVLGALFAVFCLVYSDRRSLGQTILVLVPLLAGLTLSLGLLSLFGGRLNFFNLVVLPNLIGNAVDNGVHYFRRFEETAGDTSRVQAELAPPLTASALTTMMGYGGLLLAHHAGLRSIGALAVLGLACCWLTGVVLMPGLLSIRGRRHPGTQVDPAEAA